MPMKEKLAELRNKLAEAKFYFDIGTSFLVFVNFSLLVIAASSKFQLKWQVSTFTIWMVMVPLAFIGTLLFGLILDKVIKYQESYYRVAHNRIPQVMEILQIVQRLEKRLYKIEEMIKNEKTDVQGK